MHGRSHRASKTTQHSSLQGPAEARDQVKRPQIFNFQFPISTLLEERMDKPSKYGMLPLSSHYVIFPVVQLHFCSNSPFVLMLLRFQGREESMLRLGSLQGPFELWREENNKRV